MGLPGSAKLYLFGTDDDHFDHWGCRLWRLFIDGACQIKKVLPAQFTLRVIRRSIIS
jgi:hypothetical protein